MRTIFALTLLAVSAQAGLIKNDFFSTGDGLLITDTATNLQWLSPVATRYHTYNDSFVQNIESTYGFRYASHEETYGMLVDNFGPAATIFPGDAAGYTVASNVMAVFGVAENVNCGDHVPCPRTQGLPPPTGTYAGSHYGVGAITFGTYGRYIIENSWSDTFADGQMGSWLVRSAAEQSAPEPATIGLAIAGVGLLLLRRRQQSRIR